MKLIRMPEFPTAKNKCFREKPTLHPVSLGILTVIGPATDVGQTVCCWIVSLRKLNMETSATSKYWTRSNIKDANKV